MSYRYKIATVFLLGFFIDCINIFMSAIALPNIASSFSVSQSMVAWVTNAYILGLILIMPMSLWLATKLGNQKLLCYSMLLFSISICFIGFSESIYSLIFWRFIQGVAGGLLIPVGQALVYALFPNQERQRISTMIMAIALIAPAFSPAIGGIIIDSLNWRWVFLSNLPFSLLAAALAWLWIKKTENVSSEKPDIKGLVIFNISLLSLLLSFSFYSDYHNASFALTSFLISIGMLIFYIRHAKKISHPVLNLELLKNKNLRNAFIVYYAVPGIFTGVNLLNIFNLQLNFGFNAKQTGLFMLLYATGALAAMISGGLLYQRLGKKYLLIIGITLHSLGIFLLFCISNTSPLSFLVIAYLLIGMGGGLSANIAQISSLIDFAGEDLLQGSVLWNINRQVSFSVGTVVLISIYNLMSSSSELLRYQHTFLIAALLCLLSLIPVLKEKAHV
ncbi:MFS transporter [Acinetobacter seifertii]|uniref:MFS transporter n=2 Tax=Acinetobacter TaxID=469 RepID=A0A7H2R162_9GAMM|nr:MULTISPECIES: MFS transporter [Acinetobacter]ONN56334.1 MFS transporter [Acinetobacter genomosp. 33YU]QNX11015.1 MFS transporter [Acinetobacter seifertii]QNX21095.1 MFS transporter [Acinetobacter seifertii]QNX27655.1 MFS transporter [Acinetobacter seifertii]QNX38710.1 MFS transporter [Acinetobacter seifertii]